jgi:hypothetical protein
MMLACFLLWFALRFREAEHHKLILGGQALVLLHHTNHVGYLARGTNAIASIGGFHWDLLLRFGCLSLERYHKIATDIEASLPPTRKVLPWNNTMLQLRT